MYITKGDLQGFMMQDIDMSFDSFVTLVIDAVQEYIDQYCDTAFSDDGISTKTFDGSGQKDLVIDYFQSITSINILDSDLNSIMSLTENEDYVSYPANGVPKNRLVLLGSGKLGHWPNRTFSVQINGTWGQSAVPGPIKMVALQLAAKMLDKGLRGGMNISQESLGDYSITYKTIDEEAEPLGVFDILNRYRKLGLD